MIIPAVKISVLCYYAQFLQTVAFCLRTISRRCGAYFALSTVIFLAVSGDFKADKIKWLNDS